MRRKKERSKQGQTNKAKQHSTPKAVTFPRKNELPQVGLEPTTLYTLSLDRALYQLSYRGSSAGWAQISHLIVHLMNRLTINLYMYTYKKSTCTYTIIYLYEAKNRNQMLQSNIMMMQGRELPTLFISQELRSCIMNFRVRHGVHYMYMYILCVHIHVCVECHHQYVYCVGG